MTRKRQIKLVQEGQYVAEVEVALTVSPEGWSPDLSLEDAQKLDAVRESLRSGDRKKAGQLARIFKLTPVSL